MPAVQLQQAAGWWRRSRPQHTCSLTVSLLHWEAHTQSLITRTLTRPAPAVFPAADLLLLTQGVAGSEPINGDIEWQFNTFLKTWQQGGCGVDGW